MNWLTYQRVTCELCSLGFASFNVSVQAFLYHYLSPSTTLRRGMQSNLRTAILGL